MSLKVNPGCWRFRYGSSTFVVMTAIFQYFSSSVLINLQYQITWAASWTLLSAVFKLCQYVLLIFLSSLIYAFLVCQVANKHFLRICHIGAVFALVGVDYILCGSVLFCALSLKLLMLAMHVNLLLLLLLLSFLKWECAKLESMVISLAVKTKEF